jgi:hypothetical protein
LITDQLRQIQTDVVKEVSKFTITPFFVKGGKWYFAIFFYPVEPEVLSDFLVFTDERFTLIILPFLDHGERRQ